MVRLVRTLRAGLLSGPGVAHRASATLASGSCAGWSWVGQVNSHDSVVGASFSSTAALVSFGHALADAVSG